MANRTPDSLCMLCLLRKAVKTGSHFVPAGILKHVIGPRDYEEAHSISSFDLRTDVQYGRSNIKNTDTTQKKIDHIADYLFCNECETLLGKLEGEVLRVLEKTVSEINSSNVTDSEITGDILLRVCHKLPPTLINLFFYSLIWRVSIQQRLDHGLVSVSVLFDEELRSSISNNLGKGIDVLKQENLTLPYDYSIITCDQIEDKSATYVMPGVELTNPQLFYIGPYIAIVSHEMAAKTPEIPEELLRKEFCNGKSDEPIKLVKVSKEIWATLQAPIIEYSSNNYLKTMIVRLAEKKNISKAEASQLLQEKAEELKAQYPDATEYFEELNKQYQILMD